MKLVFFGSPEFAVPSFSALHNSEHEILAVVTAPDKRAGRGKKYISLPIKLAADKYNYPIYQPLDLKDPEFLSFMNVLDADIFVVVAYRILPEEVICIPREGAVNIHASLLPKYRGPAPIHHAILNGEKETGVTIFRIEKKVDTGDILLQERFILNNNITTGEVYDNLANLGARLVLTTLDYFKTNQLVPVAQEHINATSAPKISSKDYLIHWHNSAETIHNQIRAFSPIPGAYTYFQKKRLKLFNSEIKENNSTQNLQPGEISFSNDCLMVGTGTVVIHINEIQLEGKNRLPVRSFVSGFPQIQDSKFG